MIKLIKTALPELEITPEQEKQLIILSIFSWTKPNYEFNYNY